MTPVTMFRCDGCGFLHSTEPEAVACESLGQLALKVPAEVGDIVYCGAQGWWDGDPAWCQERDPGPDWRAPRLFVGRFVVVAKVRGERDHNARQRHQVRTILWTESTRGGESGNFVTSPDHIGLELTGEKVAPEVLAEYQAKSAADLKLYTPRLP